MSKPVHELSWGAGDLPYSETFGDHFYSEADGRAETVHVFLGGNGLPARWENMERFAIGELGFGTGLNFLETWRQWAEMRQPEQHLSFTSFEGFPLSGTEIETAISKWPDLKPCLARLLAHWPGLGAVPSAWQMDGQTDLTIVQNGALAGLRAWQGRADAWYLDGFSPACNRDMWSEDLMRAVGAHTVPGGTFASYTAAGWVRRNLQAANFEVRKVPGFGRKREMIIGSLIV